MVLVKVIAGLSHHGYRLNQILKEANVCFLDDRIGNKGYASNLGLSSHAYSLDSIFKEKYQGQFEIDLENKILYRTVRSFTGYPSSIIDIKYSIETKLKDLKHPTTNPVEVLEYLIDRYTEEGDNVLDMTMGSGSTGVACKNKNRNFIGCEISKHWYSVALERIELQK